MRSEEAVTLSEEILQASRLAWAGKSSEATIACLEANIGTSEKTLAGVFGTAVGAGCLMHVGEEVREMEECTRSSDGQGAGCVQREEVDSAEI